MSAKEATQAEEIEQPVAETVTSETGKVKLEIVDSDSQDGEQASDFATASSDKPASEVDGTVRSARFAPLADSPITADQGSMDLLLDVDLDLSVELGRASMPVREILQLGSGSIVELNKLAGDAVDVLVNGRLIARGEVVVVDENFGVRITEVVSPNERLGRLA